jgi:transcriptional regulator with XRE-family HTH domain
MLSNSPRLSRYAIAKKARVDQASLSRFMNGHGSLSLDAAGRIASVLKLALLPARLWDDNQSLRSDLISAWNKADESDLERMRRETVHARLRPKTGKRVLKITRDDE